MNTPNIIEARYRIVTPMFIGDADQTPADGIRPPSVKGALRFWWRALNWGKIRVHHANDHSALHELHEQEALLFGCGGSVYDNDKRKEQRLPPIGQSRFRLQITTKNIKITSPTLSNAESGLLYLLGQGLYDHNKGILRQAITSQAKKTGTVTIKCLLHPKITAQQRATLEQALLALGILGGLGSRSRKGFGSLAIEYINAEKYTAPESTAALKTVLNNWKSAVAEPSFTAFSALTRIDQSLSGRSNNDNPLDLLNQAGREQQFFRSWGNSNNPSGEHQVNGKKAWQRFPQSHHLMQKVANGEMPNAIPDKAVFGLPQNYFFSSNNKSVEFSLKEEERSRRASPLFIHVHQFPNGESILIQSLFPAVFLEEGAKLAFKARGTKHCRYTSSMTDWNILEEYLDLFETKETL